MEKDIQGMVNDYNKKVSKVKRERTELLTV